MLLCATLIKQMEATQQAERKSMNKSLAFASASHDVRSSLAALDGIITLCSAEVSPNSEIYANLESMRTFTADLVVLLNSVLDTSKIEAGKMQLNEQDFDLAQVLEETVNLYYPAAKEKGIDLVLDPCDGSIVKHSPVKGDRGKFKQVLNNLLHNAIKFTSDGHIVVRCWVKKPSPENSILGSKSSSVWHYLLRFLHKNNESFGDLNSLEAAQQQHNTDEFVIEVDDTGKGIPKEKQKSVFEDFVQVKDTTFEHGGTGLGLGIVQSLVRLMGGDIGIMDKDIGERGTCFRFNILLSTSETTCAIGAEKHDSRLLVNQKPMESNHIRNQSPKQEGSSLVVLFIQGVERRRILEKFMQSLGVKVSSIDQLQSLFSTLERIRKQWHLGHLSWSGKSDLSDYLSTPTTSRDFNVKDGMDYPLPLYRKTSSKRTISFLLIIIDFSATEFSDGQFFELYSILESFKKDINDSRYKVVWLYTPKTNIEARRLDEKRRLAKCELIVSNPLHGSRLYEVLKLLPEFGGAPTVQRYRLKFTEENLVKQTYVRHDSSTSKSHSRHEIREVVQVSGDKSLSGVKVLVVDDNLMLRKVAITILENLGATVTCCKNGEEAVRHVCITLQKNHKSSSRFLYDFILMDCEMPIMDGYEATRQIRLEEKLYNVRIPIIALTSHEENEKQSERVLAGMDTAITKPLQPEKLYKILHFIDKFSQNSARRGRR
ncbi:Histidine kinase cki1 [Thalictrum thalictroides]|uniref:histidine kinase n=1 Tax=Thalictrum thalictroides TaxID=46969 RepID=A0A7J6WPR8_THATH|nr:Histidine kinase cki1 [Thalictrum thalictroides]